MPWNEAVFGGWGMLLIWTAIACPLSAAIAVLSSMWSRFVKAPDWIGWFISIAVSLVVFVLLPSGRFAFADLASGDLLRFLGNGGGLALTLIVPQVVAYPLTRERVWRRPLVAAGCALLGAAVWAVGGMATGATPD